MKARVGDRIDLIGGMYQVQRANGGAPEQIKKQVHLLFEKVGYEGGYILSCADHFFETPIENLQTYAAPPGSVSTEAWQGL